MAEETKKYHGSRTTVKGTLTVVKPTQWKEYCKQCKHSHYVTHKPCPSCGIHQTVQPASDSVYEQHISSRYNCDGCDAFKDHLI